jgi:dolichol-phosphate mannosyltransferase
MAHLPLISVVFSFRNEQENIRALIARLEAMFAGEAVEYELVFVNDASTDSSVAILTQEHARNARVKFVNMARRFGVGECVRAGMQVASGDAVIYMDADLQDPPEVIPRLLAKWREGADVVHTVRTRRHGESALKMLLTRLAYRVIQSGSSVELPVDAGDFKLLSRAAVMHLLSMGESDPYMRGLVIWIGFTQAFVPYEREARHGGTTHFPFFSRNPWKTFAMGMTSFSFMPVYACIASAAFGGVACLALFAATVVAWSRASAQAVPLALLLTLTVFWTTVMAGLSAIGLYVVRIYKDVRGRPQFIVASTVGIESTAAEAVHRAERGRP